MCLSGFSVHVSLAPGSHILLRSVYNRRSFLFYTSFENIFKVTVVSGVCKRQKGAFLDPGIRQKYCKILYCLPYFEWALSPLSNCHNLAVGILEQLSAWIVYAWTLVWADWLFLPLHSTHAVLIL